MGWLVQAVVVSIDPKKVYVTDPSEVPYRTVEVQQPGSTFHHRTSSVA